MKARHETRSDRTSSICTTYHVEVASNSILVLFAAAILSFTFVTSTATAGTKKPTLLTRGDISESVALTNRLGLNFTTPYSATWTYEYKGRTRIVSINQLPPLTVFRVGSGAYDETNGGVDQFVCGAGAVCPKPNGDDPLFTLRGLFIGTEMQDAISGFTTTITNAPTGVHLVFTHRVFAGLASTCISLHGQVRLIQEWCLSAHGIVTYGDYSHRILRMTRFTNHVNISAFALPQDAELMNN
jgi:hypothetical protein